MDIPMVDKNEIKIFILYLMDRIGYPLDSNTVCSIMHQENVVSFFSCAACFEELVDAHHLVDSLERDPQGNVLYSVSETGRCIATELNDQLSSSIKEVSYRSAIRHLSFMKRGASLNYKYEQLENGKFKVYCCILEHKVPVYEASIVVDTEYEAKAMINNFSQRPEIVFRGSLAVISGEANYIFEDMS